MRHVQASYECLAVKPHRGGVSTSRLGLFQAAILPRAGVKGRKPADLPLLHMARRGGRQSVGGRQGGAAHGLWSTSTLFTRGVERRAPKRQGHSGQQQPAPGKAGSPVPSRLQGC